MKRVMRRDEITMSKFEETNLMPHQIQALEVIRRNLLELFPVEAIFLYGSAARGEADPESDIDLLILTSRELSRFERHQITHLVFDVNLEHDTNFSTLVVDRFSWETGLFSVLPIHYQILEDGILV
ncbi:MAG: nucleotidyltransferase domain-containing protein [Chloroflexota bacterium]